MTRWVPPAWPGLVVGIIAAFVAGLQPLRGLNLWAVWQIDSALAFERWIDGGGDEAMAAAFAGDPWIAAPTGWLTAILVDGDEVLFGLRFVSAVLAGLTVGITAEFARRMAGPAAAVLAGGLLIVTPRFLQAATVPSPTLWLVAMAWLAMLAMLELRRRDRAFLVGVVGIAGLAHAGIAGWLWLVPVAWVLFVDLEAPAGRARLQMKPASIFMLGVVPVGLAVAVALSPWWSADPGERVPDMLEFWLTRSAEPWLHRSARFGAERIPWWSPAAIVAITWHASALVSATAGLLGGLSQRGRETRGALVAGLIASLIVPVVLRSPYHGGIDLLVLIAPAIAALGGTGIVTIASTVSTRHVGRAAGALGAFVIALAGADLARYGGATDAWTSAVVGGPRGRVALGFSRAPHPIVPVAWVRELTGNQASVNVAVLTNEWEMRPVLAAMTQQGLVEGVANLVDLGQADVAVVVWDDTLPELYGVAADAAALRGDPQLAGPVHAVRGVPIIEAWRLR